MTEPSSVLQEPDRVSGRRLLGLAASAVGVAALSVFASWWIASGRAALHSHPHPHAGSSVLAQGSTPEQTPIQTSERGLSLRAQQEQQLSSYGWVDRDAGVVRIPIERAIELRAEGSR